MRIVFFGMDSPHSRQALTAIAAAHEVVGVVRPTSGHWAATPRSRVRHLLGAAARAAGLHRTGSLDDLGRALGAPVWEARAGDDPRIAARVRAARPDLICVVSYPWLLRGEIVTDPPARSINLHAALLPRHRGPLPLFWIYYHDDRETGVTVHALTDRADAGDILGQASFALPRGFPVEELNRLNAERGAELLSRVVGELAAGTARFQPQDEARATAARRIRPGVPMVDFERWDVERVWHFCAGLFPRFIEPLTTEEGAPLRYGGVLGYEAGDTLHRPGTVTRAAHGFDLHCLGGRVRLRP